jgi:hypothetical protein
MLGSFSSAGALALLATSAEIANEEHLNRERLRERDWFRQALRTTDRYLWELEELNRAGVNQVTNDMRRQLQSVVLALAVGGEAVIPDSSSTQELLDSVFDLQDRLLRWRHPDFFADEDADAV